MNFDDNKLSSEKDYHLMKQNYTRALKEETDALEEIVEKMENQRDNLARENLDGRYDSILEKIDSNISELNNLIVGIKNASYTQFSPIIPNLQGLLNRKIHKAMSDDVAISPIRSSQEIENHSRLNANQNNMGNETNSPLESPASETTPDVKSPPDNPKRRTTQRNSPMPSNNLFNFIKSFNVKKTQRNTSFSYPQNRFHNVLAQKKCEPRNIFIDSQIDIIRLMLLYLMLRPTCRYCSRISYLTNEQFDILLELYG